MRRKHKVIYICVWPPTYGPEVNVRTMRKARAVAQVLGPGAEIQQGTIEKKYGTKGRWQKSWDVLGDREELLAKVSKGGR